MDDRQELIVAFRQCGRTFLASAIPLLETQRSDAKVDLYEPVTDEVMGGLFARVFRFLQTFVLDYHLWAEDLGTVVLRMMLESVFYMRFLSRQNQPELFLAFQRYGIGQEKLYKLQLRKLLEEGAISDSRELRQFIDSDSDEEIADELVKVSLKNFEDLRKLATDAGMKKEYVLHYQPDSIMVHGHWPSLRVYYLETCHEPLHRLHLQPTFGLPGLNPHLLNRAFRLFMDAYEMWIERYGLQDCLTPLVDQYFERCNAVTAKEEGSSGVGCPDGPPQHGN
jgi:Family of unknown function (DUF5677)